MKILKICYRPCTALSFVFPNWVKTQTITDDSSNCPDDWENNFIEVLRYIDYPLPLLNVDQALSS
jgi:hypothetical protein